MGGGEGRPVSVLSNPTARGCHQSGTNPSKTDTSTKHTHHHKCKPSKRASERTLESGLCRRPRQRSLQRLSAQRLAQVDSVDRVGVASHDGNVLGIIPAGSSLRQDMSCRHSLAQRQAAGHRTNHPGNSALVPGQIACQPVNQAVSQPHLCERSRVRTSNLSSARITLPCREDSRECMKQLAQAEQLA